MVGTDNNRNSELVKTLHGLIRDWEYEVVEFKQASNDYSQHDVGKYFSAISNEANLKNLQHGWLVFGINNKTRKSVGTDYRDTKGLDTLKHEIAQNSTGGITFIDIFEVYDSDFRIVMFKIPAAVTAVPTAWKGHWYGRDGESLVALSQEEIDRIREQVHRDWSKQIIENSSIKHLDSVAVQIAREGYKEKHNSEFINAEIDRMNDEEFLTKLKLIVNSRLTNAAMVLLGNPDHDNLLDVPVSAMWRLHGSKERMMDYEHFLMPFITLADRKYEKIRNLTYRYMPNHLTLDTAITKQYDKDLIRELLHKAMDDQYYKDLMVSYLGQWGKGKRGDFIELLGSKLPDVLSEKQKVNKVRNYLSALHRDGVIERDDENQRTGAWRLTKK